MRFNDQPRPLITFEIIPDRAGSIERSGRLVRQFIRHATDASHCLIAKSIHLIDCNAFRFFMADSDPGIDQHGG